MTLLCDSCRFCGAPGAPVRQVPAPAPVSECYCERAECVQRCAAEYTAQPESPAILAPAPAELLRPRLPTVARQSVRHYVRRCFAVGLDPLGFAFPLPAPKDHPHPLAALQCDAMLRAAIREEVLRQRPPPPPG